LGDAAGMVKGKAESMTESMNHPLTIFSIVTSRVSARRPFNRQIR
jgi:hypothetical protein